MFSRLKLWLYGAAVFSITALVAWSKYLAGRVDAEKRRADVAEAGLKRKERTEEREAEIESDWSEKERAANENLDDIPDHVRNPRGMRDPD